MVLDWQTQGASRFIPFSLSQFLIPSFKSTPAIDYNWPAKKSKHNNNRKGDQAIRKTQRQKRPGRHFCKSTNTNKDTETTHKHKETQAYTWETQRQRPKEYMRDTKTRKKI